MAKDLDGVLKVVFHALFEGDRRVVGGAWNGDREHSLVDELVVVFFESRPSWAISSLRVSIGIDNTSVMKLNRSHVSCWAVAAEGSQPALIMEAMRTLVMSVVIWLPCRIRLTYILSKVVSVSSSGCAGYCCANSGSKSFWRAKRQKEQRVEVASDAVPIIGTLQSK